MDPPAVFVWKVVTSVAMWDPREGGTATMKRLVTLFDKAAGGGRFFCPQTLGGRVLSARRSGDFLLQHAIR